MVKGGRTRRGGLLPLAALLLSLLAQQAAGDCVRTGQALTNPSGACASFTSAPGLKETVGQYAGADDATLRGVLAKLPQPSAACCQLARPFISSSCGCDYNFVSLANRFGHPAARVVAGYELLRLSACNSDTYGGIIQDHCTLDSFKAAAAIGGPIPQPPPQAPPPGMVSAESAGPRSRASPPQGGGPGGAGTGTAMREATPQDTSTLVEGSSSLRSDSPPGAAPGGSNYRTADSPILNAVTGVMRVVEQAINPSLNAATAPPSLAAAAAVPPPAAPTSAAPGPAAPASQPPATVAFALPPPAPAPAVAAQAPAQAEALVEADPATAPFLGEYVPPPTRGPAAAAAPAPSAGPLAGAALAPEQQPRAAVQPGAAPATYPLWLSQGPMQQPGG